MLIGAPPALVIVVLWLAVHLSKAININRMRIVFISLEFTAGTFSGNGVYATSQVKLASDPTHPATHGTHHDA
jgi:hypothetical protein